MYTSTESKRSKFLGFSNKSFANYIPINKIEAFETLYKALIKHYGTAEKAENEMQVQRGCLNRFFKDKKLSEHYAKKILAKFNEVRKLNKAKV
jgi:hypothetical protein